MEHCMVITTHTTQPLRPDNAKEIPIEHEDYRAIQYDFYIPAAVWDHSRVKVFRQRLESIASGATIFKGTTGVWMGQSEDTHVYRMIIREGQFDPNGTRSVLHGELGRLLADLSTWRESAQQAMMFTETDIRVTMARAPT
jgi:hypothetical protein